MQIVLTGWKEIAHYVRMGVRTVQRWETQFGFPVRRPTDTRHHAIIAIPEEIDAWMLTQSGRKKSSELEQCRNEIVRLTDELERCIATSAH